MPLSTAGKLMLAMCICPVVATPVVHKPTRDKIAKVAGYKPNDEVEAPCIDPSSIADISPAAGFLDVADIPGLSIVPNDMNNPDNNKRTSRVVPGSDLNPYPYGPIYNPPDNIIDPPSEIPVSTPATAALLVTGVGLVGIGAKKKN